MRRSTRPGGILSYCRPSRYKNLILALAAWPVFQTAACFPDPLAALNFELQSLINIALINAANTIFQNILGL